MLHPDLKLNPTALDGPLEGKTMREGAGLGLVQAGNENKDVVVLCADLTESTHAEAFRKKFPERFVELGVAEQNLVTVASGMAAMGKVPFALSYAVFSPGRNWEQIRTTICYNDQPVKIIGSHAGITVGADGGSHQALEDIALMRVLPRMTVIVPCDSNEAQKAVSAAAKTSDPTYIRLARDTTPVMTTESTPFKIGKAELFFDSRAKGKSSARISKPLDLGIIACGPALHRALMAAKRLDAEGTRVAVMNLSTISPLDTAAVIRLAGDARAIVTVEDHQVSGGMGSAVAECLAAHHPVPIEFVGIRGKFGQSGTPAELIELYEIGESHILAAAKKALLRK